jgi:hypothetical protein
VTRRAVEVIWMKEINHTYDRTITSDVRFRSVIDLETL